MSVSISVVPLSTIFGSRQFRRRPDICHLFYINILLGSIFLHMKARKLWQKLHKFCIYDNFFYITHILYVENFRFLHICHVETSDISPVDQAGLERTEAGESAPSRLEDSPRPGRAKCELCETLQDLIMGAGEEASINLPCLLILAPSWMLGLPSPTRPSWRRRRGGHCANRPFCHSDGARDREERITWRCATKRPVSGLLRAALQPSS